MRVGTILSYMLPTGASVGVVNQLIDANSVSVIDKSGAGYLIVRGVGHKRADQNDKFSDKLRDKFGITVGPCQKEQFGADVVANAKTDFHSRQSFGLKFPIPIAANEGIEVLRNKVKQMIPNRETTHPTKVRGKLRMKGHGRKTAPKFVA